MLRVDVLGTPRVAAGGAPVDVSRFARLLDEAGRTDQTERERALPRDALTERVGSHPLHEPLWERFIRVLAATGRTADALAAYAGCRKVLATELGVEPNATCNDLHLDLLTDGGPDDGPEDDARTGEPNGPSPGSSPPVSPGSSDAPGNCGCTTPTESGNPT